jgi:hypothetical protein
MMIDMPRTADDDQPASNVVGPEVDDDADEWVELPLIEPRLGKRQFGLMALFVLLTVCGVYFALERAHGGRFALLVGLGTLLFVGVTALLLLVVWITRTVFDGPVPIGAVLLAVLTSAALALYLLR